MFKHLEKHQPKQPLLLLSPRSPSEKMTHHSPIIHRPADSSVVNMWLPSKGKRHRKNGLLRKAMESQEKGVTKSHFHPLKIEEYYLEKPMRIQKEKPKTESTFSNEKGCKENNPERESKTEAGKRQTGTGHRNNKQCRLITKIKQLKKPKKPNQKPEPSHYQIKLSPALPLPQNTESIKKNQEKQENDGSELHVRAENPLLLGKEVSELDSYECNSSDSADSIQSLHLGLESKIKVPKEKLKLSAVVSKVNQFSTDQQILEHLKIIEEIYVFLEESHAFHDDMEEWQTLHFLLLKKYYLQRVKVVRYLKKYPMKSPFVIEHREISYKDIISFMKTDHCSLMMAALEQKNSKIKKELKEAYSQFERSKVGDQIHLFEYDNFSQTIIRELWIEFVLTEFNPDYSKDKLHPRLAKILQIIFLISEVSGRRLVSFDDGVQALEAESYLKYIREGKEVLEKELQPK